MVTLHQLKNICDKYYEFQSDRAYLFCLEEVSSSELAEFSEAIKDADINGIVSNFTFDNISVLDLDDLKSLRAVITEAINNFENKIGMKRPNRFEILKKE